MINKAANAKFKQSSHILLRGLPKSATSGDLRRAVMLAGIVGATDVSLVYKRFTPTGQGVLSFPASDVMRHALKATKKMTFTGCEEIGSSITVDPAMSTGQRLRGIKGRNDASNRGLLGSGPSAGFPAGRTVTVIGFPGTWTVRNFMPYVQGFELALDEENSVMQCPLPPTVFSMFARFVVMLASDSEAQRLVRKLHLTPHTYQTVTKNITARVIY